MKETQIYGKCIYKYIPANWKIYLNKGLMPKHVDYEYDG